MQYPSYMYIYMFGVKHLEQDNMKLTNISNVCTTQGLFMFFPLFRCYWCVQAAEALITGREQHVPTIRKMGCVRHMIVN